jgi:hypothetical protein
MKPTFALDLTRDAIALLHRTPKGWLSIGEVAFDAPDLAEGLDYLRKTALGLSPMGMACKVILPNSQILYTEVQAPGPSREDKRRQIAAALDGRTPYAVEDLVFDWSGKGQTVKVAVVARETLEEAEAFATAHRLNPVSFVAIPEPGSFVGEPWFGPAAAAEAMLAPGETVDRDREAVTILHRDPPIPAPAPAAAAPANSPPPATPAEDEPLPGLEEALNADLPPPPVAEAAPDDTPAPVLADTDDDSALQAEADRIAAELQAVADDPQSASAAPAPAAPDAAVPPADATGPASADPAREPDEAPFAHVTDTTAFPEDDPAPAAEAPRAESPVAAAASVTAPALPDEGDLPPAPPSAAMVAFASRRAAGAPPPAARPVVGASRPDPVGTGSASRPAVAAARPATGRTYPGLVTAPTIPGTRAKPKGRPGAGDAPAAGGAATFPVKSPARPGGTFGTTAPPRGRSGVVFMVLVALLLLFLAFIAAWLPYFLSQNGTTVPDNAAVSPAAIEVVPGVDEEMLADMQDPDGMTGPLPEAEGPALAMGDAGALATESPSSATAGGSVVTISPTVATAEPPNDTAAAPDTARPVVVIAAPDPAPAADAAALAEDAAPEAATETATEAAADPAPPATADTTAAAAPEPAPETVVATDLTAATAPTEDQDEIFLAAMDAPPPALDALALPAPAATADPTPDAAMPPPAFGTVYRFDARGLLVPTPEGILSPEGVMLIAGPPPVLPPARSPAAAEAAAAAAAAAVPPETPPAASETAPPAAGASLVTAADTPPETGAEAAPVGADPALSGFRPRPRPAGLAPETEDDAALQAPEDRAFAALRPLPRPAVVLAAAAAARPADLGAQGASLTAQAEADLAAAAALEAANPSIVAISMRPAARPRDLSRAVEAAVAAAVRTPEPDPQPETAAAAPAPELKPEELEELDEPQTASAAPSIPTKANVAKQATFVNAINLSKMNLIGTYGTDSRRTALIRQSNGRYKKVEVGDRIDGGTIKAITETEVRYQKGGKLLTLKMPKA